MSAGERLLDLMGNLPDDMLEEAWSIRKAQGGKIGKALCWIAAAACIVILFMTFVPAGQAMAAWAKERIEFILEQWFPPREISTFPEGEEENVAHEIYGELPESLAEWEENEPQEEESAGKVGFAIYVDTEIFETIEEGEDYIIHRKPISYTREDAMRDNPALLEGLSEEEAERKIQEWIEEVHRFYESLPVCEIRITQISQVTPGNVAAKLREELLQKYETVSEPEQSPLLDGLYLHGAQGNEFDDEVIEIHIVDDGMGGVFVIKALYYMEAAEGVGARFHTMIETFKVLAAEELGTSGEKRKEESF